METTIARRVVFLDADGVLNAFAGPGFKESDNDFDTVLPSAIHHLNAIVRATSAEVVISSTWRKMHTLDRFSEELAARGFVGRVVGATCELWKSSSGRLYRRGDEIAQWVRSHPLLEAFVVLDDDSDMGVVEDHFVRVDPAHGLRSEDAWKAIEVLRRRPLREHPLPTAVAVMIEREGRFVVVRSKKRGERCSLPGGHIDPGETAREAALREVHEETGLQVAGLVPLGSRVAGSNVCAAFKATYLGGEPVDSDEGSAGWATREELLNGAYPVWSEWAFALYDVAP